MEFLQELRSRGLLKQVTNESKLEQAQKKAAAVYCGIDPTAQSMHVGHLLQVMLLYRFLQAGFKPIVVIGGTTALIGDPSFKETERKLLDFDVVTTNSNAITNQLNKLFNNKVTILNNAAWLNKFSLIDYLRDFGKEFMVNYMLDKDTIRTRLLTGLSYTEFSYMLLQAYDFWHLYQNHHCLVQIGGSDQWGNITAGIEYLRKKNGAETEACGLTIELLTQSNGVKFGKTETGTIWLEPKLTSPYMLYQFFFNQSDDDVEKLLKWLTLLSLETIATIMAEHHNKPSQRHAQKMLAQAIVTFVHSEADFQTAVTISDALFSQQVKRLTLSQIEQMKGSVPWITTTEDINIIDFLVTNKICGSQKEAQDILKSNALTINDEIISDPDYHFDKTKIWHKKLFFIRKGKRNYYIIELKLKNEINNN